MHLTPDPGAIHLQILDLIAEPRFGGVWCNVKHLTDTLGRQDTNSLGEALRTLEIGKYIIRKTNPKDKNPLDNANTAWEITDKGRIRLTPLRSRTAGQFNVRLPREAQALVKSLAEEHGMTASAMAARYIEEGSRMDRFPGIDFRWTPSGRQPHVRGTGLTVWEVFQIWIDHQEDLGKVRDNYPALTAAQINPAVAFARAYLQEMPPRPVPPASFRVVKV